MKITICGSMKAYKEMEEIKDQLISQGHEVAIPQLKMETYGGTNISFRQYIEDHGGINNFPSGHDVWQHKAGAINAHFEKIEWSDAILVLNYEKNGIEGYIGGNTLIEMGLAFYLKKPIYLLQNVPDLNYKEELLGMNPIIIDNDLSLIK